MSEQVLALPLEERVGLAVAQAGRRDAELTPGAAQGRTHEEVMRAARQAIGCG